jgi:hypothetical protein
MNIAPYLPMKTVLDTALISRLGTLKPKGHRNIAESSKRGDKIRLLLVFYCHLDLMITRISIQETQPLTTRRGINDLVDTGEGKWISWTGLIKACVVNAHALGAVLLENQHWISQPLWVKDFNDEPSS